MLWFVPRYVFNLDQPVQSAEIDRAALALRWDVFRGELQQMFQYEMQASHWFYHEADDLVRTCTWRLEESEHGLWYEGIPVPSISGRMLLRELRRRMVVRRRVHTHIWGELYYRLNGKMAALEVESPHDWDFRIYRGSDRPPDLPYTLVHTTVALRRAACAAEEP